MTLNKNTFIGEYSYTLDAKGRINIPSKFRSSLSKDNDQSLVITRGMDKCIWLYPLIIWQTIENELRKLSSLSGINRTFTRNTVRYASIVQIDK
ncbi:MAG: division/cell wall cluster transcriptional repressor MraZ, partial [Candidatus Neomarinimicrobiota bacterium]|nr:division/cell wall cluster transcriptional repressor MraZ [Candidatus Neomarinimicrobiota bacterium]